MALSVAACHLPQQLLLTEEKETVSVSGGEGDGGWWGERWWVVGREMVGGGEGDGGWWGGRW